LDPDLTPLLLVGAGHMGGALISGWRRAGVIEPADLMIRDPRPGEAARAAGDWGAWLNGPDRDLSRARTVVLAVKPQMWRETAKRLEPLLAVDALIVSIVAGVGIRTLRTAFRERRVARVMPTTAAAVGRGSASVSGTGANAEDRARRLFEPLGVVVDLDDEAMLHAATGASGSAPAYFYALVEALQAAGTAAGLDAGAARTLSRQALVGAAALLESTGEDAAELRRQVTSPGGTTEAALKVLTGEGGLEPLMIRAVAAAAARSREFAAS
jgi:pyrroline-5-carboxylate reductase